VADIVAKVAGRTLWNRNLKQSNWAARAFDSMLRNLESMLRDGMLKILLQQYRHDSDLRAGSSFSAWRHSICGVIAVPAAAAGNGQDAITAHGSPWSANSTSKKQSPNRHTEVKACHHASAQWPSASS
jgi:hypothetical protein